MLKTIISTASPFMRMNYGDTLPNITIFNSKNMRKTGIRFFQFYERFDTPPTTRITGWNAAIYSPSYLSIRFPSISMPPVSVKLKASSWIHTLYIYMEALLSLPLSLNQPHIYVQRGTNVLQTIFKGHFQDFADSYEEKYAPTYGRFRLDRITEVVEHFISCGDYTQGVARIQCTNPECRNEYFRPFSCKGFNLCPSCSQKRTLLFTEYAANELLLLLPHRLLTFSIPICLRVFFRHDRKLFLRSKQAYL